MFTVFCLPTVLSYGQPAAYVMNKQLDISAGLRANNFLAKKADFENINNYNRALQRGKIHFSQVAWG